LEEDIWNSGGKKEKRKFQHYKEKGKSNPEENEVGKSVRKRWAEKPN